MYLVNRFSQLSRCEVALHFHKYLTYQWFNLRVLMEAFSATRLTLRTRHGCICTWLSRTLLAALHVHRIDTPYRAFLERVGPWILWLESVDYFRTSDYFSAHKKNNLNKTLWERIFGCLRTMGTILLTCLTAAKQLSSYLTREDKSITPLVCWTTQLIQYVPIHNKNRVISWPCLKICTSSMQTCLEPNCNIRSKWLQPGE